MLNKDLLEILRCPACSASEGGILKLERKEWLVCQDCGRKYPISEDIPVLLIDEGDKWKETAVKDLPPAPPLL